MRLIPQNQTYLEALNAQLCKKPQKHPCDKANKQFSQKIITANQPDIKNSFS
jgi:hypothetical protein